LPTRLRLTIDDHNLAAYSQHGNVLFPKIEIIHRYSQIIPKIFSCFTENSYFCTRICPLRLGCHLRVTELVGGALHIRRRYWRFVFGYSNYHNR